MRTVNFEGSLNLVGGRFVKGDRFVDVTEHCYSIGRVSDDISFGHGVEVTEAEAIDFVSKG